MNENVFLIIIFKLLESGKAEKSKQIQYEQQKANNNKQT